MKSLRRGRAAVPAVMLAILSACSGYGPYYTYGGGSPGGGTTYSLSGMVTATGLSASGYAYVTATVGAYSYYGMGTWTGSGTQTAAYSVAGLPPGTCTVTVAITTPQGTGASGTYSLDGASAVSDAPMITGGPTYTWTMTVSSVTVTSNVTLDASMP